MAASVPASLLLDRFVSASSADDAHTSLERVLEALQANSVPNQPEDVTRMAPEDIWSDPEILAALRHVLRTGNHKQNNTEVPVDEGSSLVCKIFLEMVEQEPKSPLLEKDESLVGSLIDVISTDSTEEDAVATPMYTRVLALQLLTKLCVKRSSKAQAQLLQAPNGLHRLGDLLHVNQEEIIRNEALLLAQVIAEWPSCAKIWMFSEVADQVILLALEEGGLTGGNLLVQDCLDLLFNLWKHDPNNLADLVFQSPTLANSLPRLLDLRQGTEFLNPPKKKEAAVKKDDDLDDILKSASEKESESKQDEAVVPKLTQMEEKVVEKTLNIMALLLETDSLKKAVWSQHKGLCSLLWELALVSPPPPNVPFVCSVPSPELQQKALETTAMFFHDPDTMERHSGLDRLLYLVCTGGLGSSLKERMGISQAALHVIRKTISKETASEMLMNTLAPPISMDEDGEDINQPPPPTVVHKLLNTVAENLTETQGINPERRKIFLAGALGGLSVFFMDQTSREVMLRLTTQTSNTGSSNEEEEENPEGPTAASTSLVESILHAIGTMEEVQNPEDAFLSMTLLRFLCHWSVETPSVVQAILSSNQSSTVLSALLGIKTKSQNYKKGVAVLGKLLLGLCMEYMGDDEEKCGGWTRASILELITKKSGGVSKYTSSLEQFKSVQEFGDMMPWSACQLEFKVWSQWYSESVLLVRKRVVQELTGSGEVDEEGDDDDDLVSSGNEKDLPAKGGTRSLQKMVFQQSQEIDELQQSLSKANAKINYQQSEISTYKRRIEGAPSQLDDMLTEFSSKTSELESKVATLEEEKSAMEEKHKSELKSRDDQVAALQKELEESQAREKESRDETESLREEIDSLSQAYTSLEQEYRQQQQIQTGPEARSEQEAGDHGQEGNQEQIHATDHRDGSTASSTLRAENERLRSDAQAADQWMAMAVEKMKGLGEQNAMLQTELNNLRESQNNSMNEQHQQLQQQYNVLFEENQSRVQQQHQLQAQLDNASKDTKHIEQVLKQEREKYSELQQQLSQTQEELQSTVASLEENRSKFSMSEAEFERKTTALESDMKSATAEIERLRAELSQQQQELETQEQRLHANADNEEPNAQAAGNEAAIEKLQQTIAEQSSSFNIERESLQKEIEKAREDLEKTRRHEQEEMYKREARIRELEARISNGTGGGGYTEEDIKSRDEEISELRAANEAAQDWMAKAVEHHQMLSERHASVTAENASLSSQVRELTAKVAQNDALVSKANILEQECSMQASQLREAQSSLTACEDEVKRLREELSKTKNEANNSAGANDEAERLRDQVKSLDNSLREKVALCVDLRNELDAETETKEEALAELRSLKLEMEQFTSEANSLREEVQSLRASEQNATAEEKQKVSELYTQLQNIKKANSELERARDDDKNTIDRLKGEVAPLHIERERGGQSLVGRAPVSQADTQGSGGTTAHVVFGGGPLHSASAHDVFGNGPAAQNVFTGEPAAAQLNQTGSAHGVLGGGTAMGQVSAHDVFGSGAPSAPQASPAQTAQDVFNSGTTTNSPDIFGHSPAIGQASEGATAHDVFGSGSTTGQSTQAHSVTDSIQEKTFPMDASAPELGTADLSRQLAEKTRAVDELETRLKALTAELDDAKKRISDDEAVVHAWEGRIAELEETVKDLEKQLGEQEEEADRVISQWQSTCNALEERNTELMKSMEDSQEHVASQEAEDDKDAITALKTELNETRTALAESKAKVDEDAGVLLKWEERVADHESTIKDLEVQLKEQEEEASNAIAQWQENCSSLEKKNAELSQLLEAHGENQEGDGNDLVGMQDLNMACQKELEETKAALAEAQTKLDGADSVVVKWEERVAELETTVKDLEVQLSEQEEEASNVISRWQESYTALEEKNTELLRSLEASRNGNEDEDLSPESFAILKRKLEETEAALAEARDNLTDDGDVVLRWQERVAELESTVKDLETQLSEQEEEATNVIAKWQETCTALEEKNSELALSLTPSSAAQDVHRGDGQQADSASFASLQSRLKETESALAEARENAEESGNAVSRWQERVTELEGTVQELETQLSQQADEASDAIAKWQETCTTLENENAKLSQSLQSSAVSQKDQETSSDLQYELDGVKAALADTQKKLNDGEVVVQEREKRIEGLEGLVKDLEQRLGVQEEEGNSTIARWQESYNALESKNTELQQSLDAATEEHEIAVKDLEQKLKAQEEEAKDVIARWQESYDALKAKETELEQSLQDSSTRQETTVKDLEASIKDLENKLSLQEDEANNAIVKWQESYHALEKKNAELEESLEAAASNKSELEVLEQKLSDQEEEASNAIAKWQESYNVLEAKNGDLLQSLEAATAKQEDDYSKINSLQLKLKEAEEALAETREKLHNSESEASASNARVAGLEADVASLEKKLTDQQKEGNDIVEKWQESYKTLEDKNAELAEALGEAQSQAQELEAQRETMKSLEAKLKDTEASLAEAKSKLADDENAVLQWEKRVTELEATVQDLEQQLSDQEKEASDAISKWYEQNNILEQANAELTESLEAALNKSKKLQDESDSLASSQAGLAGAESALAEEKKKVSDKDAEILELKGRVEELEAMIHNLQQQLLEQEKEANNARNSSEENLQGKVAENNELARLLEEAKSRIDELEQDDGAKKKEVESSLSKQQADKEHISALQSSLKESEASLLESKQNLTQAEDSLREYEEKVSQLEANVSDLEDQIKAKDKDMATSIAEWQEHCYALESKATELSDALEKARKERSGNRDSSDYEGNLEERVEEMETTIKDLEREIEDTEKEAADVVAHWQESYGVLEARNNELTTETESLSEEVRSLREIKFSLSEELQQYKDLEAEARNEVSTLNIRLESLGDEIRKEWNDKVEELKAKIAVLEPNAAVIDAGRSETADGLSLEELETFLSLKEQELSDVTAQLDRTTKERDEAVAALNKSNEMETAAPSSNAIESSWSDDLDDIDIGEDMEPEGAQETNSNVERLDEEAHNLKEERDDATKALNDARETVKRLTREQEEAKGETEEIVEHWTARTKQLEATIRDLEEQLESQTADATEAIASWDSRCTELYESLDEKNRELESNRAEFLEVLRTELGFKKKLLALCDDNFRTSPESTKEDDDGHVDTLREDLKELNDTFEEKFINWNTEMQKLREELNENETNSVEAARVAMESAEVNTSKEESLKSKISELEIEVSEKTSNEDSLKSRIAELEKQITESEASISQLETCLTSERELLGSLKADNGKLETNIDKERTEKESLNAEVRRLKERVAELSALETDFTSRVEKAKTESTEYQDLLKEKTTLERNVEQLEIFSSELEDELKEANDSLQVYATREVSDKATEVASEALRRQLSEIRQQAEADRASFESEKETRIAAQREVDRLRGDLHALVDIDEQEKALYGPDALTLKAGEKIHKKERSEITELRKSLSRAVDELREARAAERNAEERANKASLHVSVCEEELASAKSDLHYLIQTMDEMRESEAARRASLENRISSLDNELDVLRRFHSSESDKLRSELNQVTLEKERVFQSLKDSEKTNTSLVFAASREYPGSSDQSPEAELVKLRIEKAQLLTAASEEGIRTERRLREVIATELSSAEADILVERERRLASEAAVKNMQLLVSELQNDARSRQEDVLRGTSSVKLGMEQENERLKTEINQLSEENASLRLKLDGADSAQESANYKIEKLKEECRMAQAKLHRHDRETRFNTEVQAELTRLRVSPKKQNGQIAIQEDPATDKPDDVAELYEKVQAQTEAIRKEREMYRELETEHEDLLALLAEQEEMKKCLLASLERLGGHEAVDAANREFKESMQTYGGDSQ